MSATTTARSVSVLPIAISMTTPAASSSSHSYSPSYYYHHHPTPTNSTTRTNITHIQPHTLHLPILGPPFKTPPPPSAVAIAAFRATSRVAAVSSSVSWAKRRFSWSMLLALKKRFRMSVVCRVSLFFELLFPSRGVGFSGSGLTCWDLRVRA